MMSTMALPAVLSVKAEALLEPCLFEQSAQMRSRESWTD